MLREGGRRDGGQYKDIGCGEGERKSLGDKSVPAQKFRQFKLISHKKSKN